MPQVAQIINFDEVTYQLIEIIKNDEKYALRDDVSMDVVAPLLPLMAEMESLKDLRTGAGNDEVVAAAQTIEAIGQRLTQIVGNIFRHSLPHLTDVQIGQTFSFDERLQLAQLFFSLAGKRYAPQPGSTPTQTNVVSMASAKRRRRRH